MSRLADAGKDVQNLTIDLARIGLPGHGVNLLETHLACDELIELPDFVVIAAKQSEKARLRARGSFGPPKAKLAHAVLNFIEVQDKIVAPQARSFPDRRQLGRLKMSETQSRETAMALG